MQTPLTPAGLPLFDHASHREATFGPARTELKRILLLENSTANLLAQARSILAVEGNSRGLNHRQRAAAAAAARIRTAVHTLAHDGSDEANALRRKAQDLLARLA